MSRRRRFIQCDVFTAVPTRGNALAVVVDGEDLSVDAMRQFAAWTNLAETTFLLPPTEPTADYRVRIFTPVREMLFAGHPTLGSCAAWLHCGGRPGQSGLVRQECAIGLVDIDISGEVPAFVAPPTRIDRLSEGTFDAICASLALEPAQVVRSAFLDNGPQWRALWLIDAEAVLSVDSSGVSWPEHQPVGLVGPWPSSADDDYEVRMLAPSSGMSEDPITGSLNAALAHWMQVHGALERDVTVAQGRVIGRAGRVFIRPDPRDRSIVRIGGQSHVLIDGSVML